MSRLLSPAEMIEYRLEKIEGMLQAILDGAEKYAKERAREASGDGLEPIESVLRRPFWSIQDIARIYGYSSSHVGKLCRMPGFPGIHGTRKRPRFAAQRVRAFMYSLGRMEITKYREFMSSLKKT